MLLEFKFSNYTSFKEKVVFSMVGVNTGGHGDTHTVKINNDLRVVKSAAVYGANASGKSNFLEALGFMRSTVLNSFRDALDQEGANRFKLEKFALNSKSLSEPSFFEVTFFHNARKYRYGFEVDESAVRSEYLYSSLRRETMMFKREGQSIEVNNSSFSEGQSLMDKVKDNVLFLTMVAQLNGQVASDVVKWFQLIGIVTGIYDFGHMDYTKNKLKEDKEFQSFVAAFLKILEISNITIDDANSSQTFASIIQSQKGTNQKKSPRSPDRERVNSLLSWHAKYDENNMLLDSVPFNFDAQESAGTRKFIYLLGPWYDSLKRGRVMVVDELESRLHYHLTLKLLEFFHSERNQRAQLIFATHDTALLHPDHLRKDQVWFVEKDQFGASKLYPLTDFSSKDVRNNTVFSNHYIGGKYGAIPQPVDTEVAEDYIYGKGGQTAPGTE